MGALSITSINVSSVEPEVKDFERALGFEFKQEGYPIGKLAVKMSNSIKDPLKLIRRSKAVVGIWGKENYNNSPLENAWVPFRVALERMGFTDKQIEEIGEYEIDSSITSTTKTLF